jgi:hypothetical protein
VFFAGHARFTTQPATGAEVPGGGYNQGISVKSVSALRGHVIRIVSGHEQIALRQENQ